MNQPTPQAAWFFFLRDLCPLAFSSGGEGGGGEATSFGGAGCGTISGRQEARSFGRPHFSSASAEVDVRSPLVVGSKNEAIGTYLCYKFLHEECFGRVVMFFRVPRL